MSQQQPVELTQEEMDKSLAQIEKILPTVRKILDVIHEAKLPMGEIKKTDTDKRAAYDDVRTKILEIFLAENLTRDEMGLCNALVLQPFSLVTKGVEHSIAISWDAARSAKWQMDEGDVTFGMMDDILKSDAALKLKKDKGISGSVPIVGKEGNA